MSVLQTKKNISLQKDGGRSRTGARPQRKLQKPRANESRQKRWKGRGTNKEEMGVHEITLRSTSEKTKKWRGKRQRACGKKSENRAG